MKNTFLKLIGTAAMAILILAMFAQISVSAQDKSSETQSDEQIQEDSFKPGGARALEGSWDVQVTVRNCQTGAAITTFPAMGTFMFGGTALVSEAGIPSALKTPAHGVWSHIMRNTYRFKTKAFNFNASGNFTGWIIINNEANLNRRADKFTSIGTAEVYAPNGNLLFTGCSTTTATRFE